MILSENRHPLFGIMLWRSTDGLVALKRGGEFAFLFGGLALHQFLLGQHALVIAAVGDRTDHRAGPALARLVHERAQILFPVDQLLPSRHQVVAVIGLVAARIDHPRARAVAKTAAGKRHGGGGAQQKAAARSRAAPQAQWERWLRGDPLLCRAARPNAFLIDTVRSNIARFVCSLVRRK